jgi:hypothetical protein
MTDRNEETANRWARLAALAVGLIALAVVVWPGVAHLDLGDPYRDKQQVTEKVTISPAGARTVERTTSPAKPGLLDQALASGGLLLLRIGVAAAAAFLAGAATQRILLGEFAFSAGGVELPAVQEVADSTARAIELLQTKVRKQQAKVRKQEESITDIAALLGRMVEMLPATAGEAAEEK